MKILHCADLHVSTGEEAYAFSVLDEVIDVAGRERVGLLLFAGDTFDSYDDAEAFRDGFARRLTRLRADCACVLIPGNHETLGASERRNVSLLGFGDRVVVAGEVGLLPISEEVEVLAVPHRPRYDDYQDWAVGPKRATVRLALAHATVSGMSFAGLATEDGGAVIDPDLFVFHHVDYAALGHIHAGRYRRHASGLVVAYPGSARVWRSGEAGDRCVLLVDLAGARDPRPVPLEAAGRWSAVEVPLAPDGTVAVAPLAASAAATDWLEVRLTGVADDDDVRARAVRVVREALERRVRKLDVVPDDVLILSGAMEEPVVRRFLDAWEKRLGAAGEADRQALFRARAIGLERIVDVVGAR